MTTATATAVRAYQIDKAHSEATFQVRHLLTRVRGRFTDFSGAVVFDEEHPERSTVEASLVASSIDTGQPDRDAHLRSGDFFAADDHPTLTFRSTSVVPLGRDRLDVTGDLTIRGITHQVVLPVTYLGNATDPWGKERAGFEAELTINRRDFGLHWNAALETGGFLVGDEVRIALSVQATAR